MIQLGLAALLVAVSGSLYWLLPICFKSFLRRRFLRFIHQSGCTCLTFDDGPHPVATPKILDILKDFGCKATFYPIGANAEKFPELIERLLQEGHEIGDHSYRHCNALKSGPVKTWRDLVAGRQALKKYQRRGASVSFRPPFGKINIISLWYMFQHRRYVSFWNIDPRDYARASAEVVADLVQQRMEPGTVVLLHDGRVNPGSGDPEVTVEAVRAILQSARNRGLLMTTISEAIHRGQRQGAVHR